MVLVTACGNPGSSGSSASQEESKLSIRDNNLRNQAASVIEHRRASEPKPMAIIVANYWEYDLVFENGAMSEKGAHAGEWIKFNEDWTYNYGSYDKTTGSGKYHHSFENNLIVMLDDDINVPAVEFETKYGQEVIILVGKPTYGSNGRQMKIRKIAEQPKK